MKKEVKQKIESYILSKIDGTSYKRKPETTYQKLLFLAETFKDEYCNKNSLKLYKSVQLMMAEWISDLPSSFNIDFEYSEILKIAKSFGNLPEKLTEEQEDEILEKWFHFIAGKTLQLMENHGIPRIYFLTNLK